MLKNILVLGFAIGVLSGGSARAATDGLTSPGTLVLPTFELSFLNANQGSGNTSSGMLAWTPRYRFDERFGLRANLGVSALKGKKSRGGDLTFAVIDAEVLLRIYFAEHFDVEVGGGIQDWDNQGGVQGATSVNVAYHFAPTLLGFIDRVFIGHTSVFFTEYVSEIRAGLGASF